MIRWIYTVGLTVPLFLSNIAGNLTEIAMVNDGIFKILQIKY